MSNIALVVPSIREDSFKRFIDEWKPLGLFEQVDLILMEDNPTPTFPTPETGGNVVHFSWLDIDNKPWGHIIPRRSDTVRSYAYWWAWRQGYEFIMTLDDDCYPSKDYSDLVGSHMSMLNDRTKWYNTLNNVIPRGMPYYNRGSRPVYINHGLWQGVLDYDAPHQLVDPMPEIFDHSNRIVPSGAYFPMCGMNVMWRAEATVLMYHLLMGQTVGDKDAGGCPRECDDFDVASSLTKLSFDRFGDIWCGIIMKKIADHLGWAVSTGTPYIHHDRASSPFTNLRKEANGIEVNEWFWQKIDAISLYNCGGARQMDPVRCYADIAYSVKRFGGEHSEYWVKLGNAMLKWAQLFTNDFFL